jgi:hypothetical protein
LGYFDRLQPVKIPHSCFSTLGLFLRSWRQNYAVGPSSGESFDDLAGKAGAAVNQTGVKLDQSSPRIQAGAGTVRVHNPSAGDYGQAAFQAVQGTPQGGLGDKIERATAEAAGFCGKGRG